MDFRYYQFIAMEQNGRVAQAGSNKVVDNDVFIVTHFRHVLGCLPSFAAFSSRKSGNRKKKSVRHKYVSMQKEQYLKKKNRQYVVKMDV